VQKHDAGSRKRERLQCYFCWTPLAPTGQTVNTATLVKCAGMNPRAAGRIELADAAGFAKQWDYSAEGPLEPKVTSDRDF
jgi:hypothetical protein